MNSMSDHRKRGATYADLFDLPAHKVGEIIDGELVVSPRPASPHARASAMLGGKLMGPFDDRIGKMPVNARYKVAHAWLIDPSLHTLEVFRLEGTRWSLIGTWADSARVRAEPFDAVEIPLESLWVPAAAG